MHFLFSALRYLRRLVWYCYTDILCLIFLFWLKAAHISNYIRSLNGILGRMKKTNHRQIASKIDAWYQTHEISIPKTPFATPGRDRRTSHFAMTHPTKWDWHQSYNTVESQISMRTSAFHLQVRQHTVFSKCVITLIFYGYFLLLIHILWAAKKLRSL